jgi:hypothetical protein
LFVEGKNQLGVACDTSIGDLDHVSDRKQRFLLFFLQDGGTSEMTGDAESMIGLVPVSLCRFRCIEIYQKN